MNAKAQRRAELIWQVRSGQITATEAAQQLGISRQQYYEWEKRALSALLTALADQPTGRPKAPTDPEKETLQRRVQQLEQQVQLHQEHGPFDTVGGQNRANLRRVFLHVYGSVDP
jgi:transposase-like protein